MISYFFYILIIVVFCLPIGGFLLNSKETDPFQLYKTMVGDRNFFKENSEHQQSLSEQRRDTRYLMERVKDSQRLARMQQQDQGRKLERLREEQRSRQRQKKPRRRKRRSRPDVILFGCGVITPVFFLFFCLRLSSFLPRYAQMRMLSRTSAPNLSASFSR